MKFIGKTLDNSYICGVDRGIVKLILIDIIMFNLKLFSQCHRSADFMG